MDLNRASIASNLINKNPIKINTVVSSESRGINCNL